MVGAGDQHSGRFSVIPARALFDKRLGDAALRVLGILGCYSNRSGWCFPSLATLASQTGVSRAAIAKQIAILIDLGYLQKQTRLHPNGAHKSNRYRILMDVDDAEDQDGEVYTPFRGVNLQGFTPPQPPEVYTIRTSQENDPTSLPPVGGERKSPFGESSPGSSGVPLSPQRARALDLSSEDTAPPPPTKEERDAVWDAYTEATGITPVTKADRSNLGQIVRDTLEAGITPRQVKAATKQARLDWERESMITWRAIYHNIGPLLKRSRERKERDSQPIV